MDGMSGRMKGVQGPWPRRTARKGEDKTNRKARGGLKGFTTLPRGALFELGDGGLELSIRKAQYTSYSHQFSDVGCFIWSV